MSADFSLETTASPRVFRAAVEGTAPTGVCGLIGAPAFGTEAAFDVNSILVFGRTIRGIVDGDSVPSVFLPRLLERWRQGRLPIERIMTLPTTTSTRSTGPPAMPSPAT